MPLSLTSVSWRRPTSLVLLALVLGSSLVGESQAQSTYYDRNEIPGHYTLGFYADEEGQVGRITLPEGEQVFECYVGITGDSTRVFSAMVFRMELPTGVQLAEPILWAPVPGLSQRDSAVEKGAQVEFNQQCLVQDDDTPVMVGRVTIRVAPEVGDFDLVPLEHRDYGLSVELCDDAAGWPKPFAEPIALEVRRKKGFWSRVKGWFGG